MRVKEACRKASQSFASWSSMPAPKRADLIIKCADWIHLRKSRFIKAIMQETGKTLEQAEGEIQSAIDMGYFIAGEGRRMYGDTTTSALPQRWAMTKRYPIGVVAIIVPWNFPLALAAWKSFPALVCGNTVVMKGSRRTPITTALFEEAMHLPHGVFTTVSSGETLIQDNHIDMVSFTGSTEVGRKIAESCGKRLIKCSLELGGKNAAIVLDDADLELAARCIANGAFSFGGQRCASTSRCIVHKDVFDKFIALLESEAEKYPKYRIWSRLKDDSDWNTELFSPELIVKQANSFNHALSLHNDSQYGLTGSIFTRNINKALQALDQMKCGVCYVNAPTFGSEVHLPFGGMRSSGNGLREVGKSAMETFTELKTIYIDYSGGMQNAQQPKL